jgi:hypothetical protein
MLHDSPLFLPAPIYRLHKDRGYLLWGWKTLQVTGFNQIVEYQVTGGVVDPNTVLNVFTDLLGVLTGNSTVQKAWSIYQLLVDLGVIPASDVTRSDGRLSWMQHFGELGSPTYYPFAGAYHHIAAVLNRRHIIHSTVTGSSNGVQISLLGDALGGKISFDEPTIQAAASLFGTLTQIGVGVQHVYDSLVMAISRSSEGVLQNMVNLDLKVTTTSGIIPVVANEAFLSEFRGDIGLTWTDAISKFGSSKISTLIGTEFDSDSPVLV